MTSVWQSTTRRLDNQRTLPEHEKFVSALRIVVLGAGGVGGYFGARLARTGESITLLARGAHLDAIRREGLRVRSSVEGEYVVKVEAVDRLDGQPPADAILVCVKAFDTERALAAVRPVVGASTAVLSLQNGVDSADTIEAVLGPGHAVGGAAYVFASIEAPGVITHRFAGRLAFGELDGRISTRCQRLREAFERAGVPVEVSTDIRRVVWEKYLLICAQAAVTAITRCPTGVIREVPETWRLYRLILEELASLAEAAGITLSPNIVESLMKAAAALGAETTSSLAYDLNQGKRLELEALHGHAVRLAERLGVAVPTVFAVYAALKPYALGPARLPGGEPRARSA
jgi:2-dehydropantoate 2-reductase